MTVLEIGCGTLGGFVPVLLDGGYQAVGVDPEALEGPDYRRVEFEGYAPAVAGGVRGRLLSLHHVADLDEVLDRLGALLFSVGRWWW